MPHLDVRRRGSGTARRLLFADEPEPRALQGVFVLLFALDLVLRSVGGTTFHLRSWPAAGAAIALLACAAAVAVPWTRLHDCKSARHGLPRGKSPTPTPPDGL